jgi:hypothetical protein
LHWHILSVCRSSSADRHFWAGATPADLLGVETSALNPTDQLLHTCLAGLRWDYLVPIWWVADAVMVLQHESGCLDANRLLALAGERRLGLLLYRTLQDLQNFGATLPADLLRSLAATPVSRTDRHEFECMTQPYRVRTLSAWMAGTYRQYERSDEGTLVGHLWRVMRLGGIAAPGDAHPASTPR